MKGGDDPLGAPPAAIPCIIESDRAPAACRKSWARLIQKIYGVDPLICPICRGTMRIISSIEDREIVKTILQHLGLWPIRSRPPAKAHAPPVREYAADGLPRLPQRRRLRRSRLPVGC